MLIEQEVHASGSHTRILRDLPSSFLSLLSSPPVKYLEHKLSFLDPVRCRSQLNTGEC